MKVNGFRIEPAEVEAALAQHPAVKQASVVAEDGARLVAYFSTVDGLRPNPEELSAFLAAKLPAHMMPSLYRQVAAFPLNANGKVDRNALPAAAVSPNLTQAAGTQRSSPMEEQVASIWHSVLDTERFSFDDNFFDVGGTSLLLIAARTALQESLGREIPITWMFEYTTVRAMARRLDQPAVANVARNGDAGTNARRQRDAFARAKAARSCA